MEFIHKHLADAAYTILDGMNNPFWRKQYHGPLSVIKCPPPDTQDKPSIPVHKANMSIPGRRPSSLTPFVRSPAPTPAPAAPVPEPPTMPEPLLISDEDGNEAVIPGPGCLSSAALVPEKGGHTTRDVNALYGGLAADYFKSDAEDGDYTEDEDPQDNPPIPQPIEIDVEMENAFALLQEKETRESVPIDPRGSRSASRSHSPDNEGLPSSSRRKRQIKVHRLRSRSPSGSSMTLSSDQEDEEDEEDEQNSDHIHEESKVKTGPRLSSGSTVSTSSSALLPKVPHGRARRVLVPSSPGLPVATISMRADAQFIDPERQ